MTRRVVVTSLGVLTSNANNQLEFTRDLRDGRPGISRITAFPTDKYRVHIGGEVHNIPATPFEIDRTTHLALLAAEETLGQTGLTEKQLSNCPLFFGTLSGPAISLEEYVLSGRTKNFLPAKLRLATTVKEVAAKYALHGKVRTISNACAASTVAIGLAFDYLHNDEGDIALAGGSDSFNLTTFSGFHALRSLDPVACRPFDKNRQGLVASEGAGFILLEEYNHALRRGAPILGEILGYGLSSDAYHDTSPEPTGKGALMAMRLALASAQISPDQIGYVNAHGTGTLQNDRAEAMAINSLFTKVPVSSTKSQIGHAMGAAGVIEAIATLIALKNGFLPPTINFQEADPDCPLDVIPNQAREQICRYALSNNFGFGGTNA